MLMGSECAVAFNNEVLYDSGAAGYCVVKGMWAAHPPGLTYTALHVPEYGEVITQSPMHYPITIHNQSQIQIFSIIN